MSLPSEVLRGIRGIRVVSWDVDGTLYSRSRLKRAVVARLLRSRPLGALAHLRGLHRYHQDVESQRKADAVVDASTFTRHQVARELERWLLPQLLRRVGPHAPALEWMKAFAASGIRQVALTDFEARDKLGALGADRYLSGSYVCEALGYWKPSPVAFLRVQQDAGVEPSEHLHLGDRLDTDGEGARRAGCRFHLLRA